MDTNRYSVPFALIGQTVDVLRRAGQLLMFQPTPRPGRSADCNDAARVVTDPMHKFLVGRDPVTGPDLASQPTLSRFENAVDWPALRDMAHELADTIIEHHRRRLKGRATRITIDLDPTDDPTHGEQEFTFFNGHYDTWCYLPLVATVTFNNEPVQYAVAAVLRPGNAPATRGARGILRRLLAKLRAAFPAAAFRVRLDGGFASPKLFANGAISEFGLASRQRSLTLSSLPKTPVGIVTHLISMTGDGIDVYATYSLATPEDTSPDRHLTVTSNGCRVRDGVGTVVGIVDPRPVPCTVQLDAGIVDPHDQTVRVSWQVRRRDTNAVVIQQDLPYVSTARQVLGGGGPASRRIVIDRTSPALMAVDEFSVVVRVYRPLSGRVKEFRSSRFSVSVEDRFDRRHP